MPFAVGRSGFNFYVKSYQRLLQKVCIAFLSGDLHEENSIKKKLAKFACYVFDKVLLEVPPFLCDRI